ncbi:MAG TPA: hypothetical protein VHT21_00985, partial [Stellaceae bacterium]|nr:hypothetical protein [Stellaceae bacterium]
MPAGDGLDTALGEEPVLSRVDGLRVGEIVLTRFRPRARQAAKMLSAAVVAGEAKGAPVINFRSEGRGFPKTA